jgi:hypothetical protein
MQKHATLLWSPMARSEIYLHFLLTHPRAFLLMGYFEIVARALNSNTFAFKTDELVTVGHKPVLTPQQVRQAIKFLKLRGYIKSDKHPTLPHYMNVTIIWEGFPYD